MKPARWAAALLVAILLAVTLWVRQPDDTPLALTIVHTNDTHAHHEPQDDGKGEGGDGRMAHLIRQLRRTRQHVLLLDAGDRFAGTLFFNQHKGLDNVEVMNRLQFQVMAVGNHEFDVGDVGLAKFIAQINFPLVSANVDVSAVPELAGKILPAVVVRVAGRPVGIIGVTTADTKVTSAPSPNVRFDPDYVGRVQAQADRLRRQGINRLIVLSHIGLAEDRKLAQQIRGVSVIVGGHSHTILSNTFAKADVKHYPVVETNPDGWSVYIVQAGCNNRFVGQLDLEFAADGSVSKVSGDSLYLDPLVPADADVLATVARLAEPIRQLKNTPLPGPVTCAMPLPSDRGRQHEIVLGNLIADAFRAKADSDIAFVGSGTVRAPLPTTRPVTFGDVYTVMPFNNVLCQATYTGADLRKALENGVSTWEEKKGRFLQVAGLRYTFNPAAPPGQRLRSVSVEDRSQPGNFRPLEGARRYTVALDSFLRSGGDGFTVLRDRGEAAIDDLGPVQDVVIAHFGKISPLHGKLEGRIKQVDK
jgi:5'-nucleotidase